MSISLPLPLPRRAEGVRADEVARTWPWERIGFLGILLLSAALELWHLDQLGTGNSFYAAAVLSMTQNLHALLFNSLDSVGFVTIDKPPLGFWIQVIFAKVLGFSGFSILLPQALATVASVALLYHLVKGAFGTGAGLLAALFLALVPVSVMIGRNNTIDALLVLTMVVSVMTVLKATERGSVKWLLMTGAIVGLGFEIKMLEAYLVVPALGLVYLLGAPISRRARIAHLALATCVMLVVSLAWPVAVDLTPANLRPWMDSTQDNSAVSLAFGYNGIQRLLGQRESLTQFLRGLGLTLSASSSETTTTTGGFGGPGGMFNNGPAGPFRLLDEQLAGQASWLLPMALVGILGGLWGAWRNRLAFVHSRGGQTTIVFGAWLLTAGAFFSVANFFHSYYLVTLGPPIAALAAIGVTTAWQSSRRWLVLPAALVATALIQARVLSYYPTWNTWLIPLVLGMTIVAAAALVAFRRNLVLARASAAVAVAALLVAPVVWSGFSTLRGSGGGGLPAAGPQVANASGRFGDGPPPGGAPTEGRGAAAGRGVPADAFGGLGAFGGEASSDVIDFLKAKQGSATYLVATTNSNSAASIILASGGKPVMSIGGFSGSDPILTVDQFANLVRSGQVRYVLVGGGPGGFGRGGASETSSIMSWVTTNGTPVSGMSQLYDLGALAGTSA